MKHSTLIRELKEAVSYMKTDRPYALARFETILHQCSHAQRLEIRDTLHEMIEESQVEVSR